MKNGDVIRIEITDVTNEAMGVGHYDKMAIFVPRSVRGDVLDVEITKLKKNYAYAKIKNIVSKSNKRCKPPCDAYKQCGGCHYYIEQNKPVFHIISTYIRPRAP